MKRLFCIFLTVTCLFLCSCGELIPDGTQSPDIGIAPSPSAEPKGLEAWLIRTESRYNMEYADFAEYWSMLCDEFYGSSTETLLSVSDLNDNDAQIEAKRAEYAKKYGDDWHYEIVSYTVIPLSEKDCLSFKAELDDIADRAGRICSKADGWTDSEWLEFTSSRHCTLYEAKAVIAACGNIEKLCRNASVTDAKTLDLKIEFTGSKCGRLETSEENTVYEVNGVFVSEMLIDSSIALLNILA